MPWRRKSNSTKNQDLHPCTTAPASRNRCIGRRYTVNNADVKHQCASLSKHLGLTLGQLEYLNPQLINKRTGKCAVKSGQRVCRGELTQEPPTF